MGRMLDVVVGGRARGPGTERHADLVSLVRWSYDLLGPDEARLLPPPLACSSGGSTSASPSGWPAALGVASPTATVARLAEASLLTVDGDPPRFAMFNTIRAFGEGELGLHGETDRASALLVGWATDLAAEVEGGFYGPDQVQVVTRVLSELANLRAARRIALETGDLGSLARSWPASARSSAGPCCVSCSAGPGSWPTTPVSSATRSGPGCWPRAAFAAWRQGDLAAADRMVRGGPRHRRPAGAP